MPEGDTIFRAARTLHRALAGQRVTRFESVFPRLMQADANQRIAGRLVDRVESRGKHLLIWFEGGLALRTHMRMNGSWHVYRPGERWQRPHRDMRIVVETPAMHAIAFSVPVAELLTADDVERSRALRDLGPDLLGADFDPDAAVERLSARASMEVADALLDQSALAGIGNVYKSEVLFLGRINPFTLVGTLERAQLTTLVSIAVRLLRSNVAEGSDAGLRTFGGARRTTGRDDPSASLWVYGRAGKPCRRCGTPIVRQKQGPNARSTYWCPSCQPQRAS